MPVVSNTSPLLNLAIINQLNLIQQQFGQIIIPDAVFTELRINENLPGSQLLQDALTQGWIIIETVENQALAQLLSRELDMGEAHAIALALQLNAHLLLLDERDARKIARTLNLNLTGVLGIIIRAWRDGQITSVKELINQLRLKANFRIAAHLEQQILTETNELNN